MKQITHDNHYVPQLYLKQWSDDGTHLWAYRLLVPHEKSRVWKKYSIRHLAVQRDLYTSTVDGEEVDKFERFLAEEIEYPAQESIQKAVNNSKLSKTDWERLIYFAVAQDIRTPYSFFKFIERSEKFLSESFQDILDASIQEFEELINSNQHPPQTDNEYISLFGTAFNVETYSDTDTHKIIKAEVSIGRALWLAQNQHILSNTIKKLLSNKWSIVKPAEGYCWFTSDCPVIRLNYYGENTYDLKGGWKVNKGNILVPLSPQHLLFTQIGDTYPEQFTATLENTRKFQRYIAENAFRWIFSDKTDYSICGLRQRNINKEAYDNERIQWESWHKQQSKAEKDFQQAKLNTPKPE